MSVSNYQKGDNQILLEIANRSEDYDFIHSIVFGFIDIYRANSTIQCKEPLENIYNKMNCGLHRKDIVNLLADNNVLSDKILKEIQYDSFDDLRKLYRQKKTAGNTYFALFSLPALATRTAQTITVACHLRHIQTKQLINENIFN